jgi:hypothetical protein
MPYRCGQLTDRAGCDAPAAQACKENIEVRQ